MAEDICNAKNGNVIIIENRWEIPRNQQENSNPDRTIGKKKYTKKIEKCFSNIRKDVQSRLYLQKFKLTVHEISRNRQELSKLDKECKKTIANIILNGEKLESFQLRQGKR